MKHSYACKVLRDNKLKIFQANKRILDNKYLKSHPALVTILNKQSEVIRESLKDGGIKPIYDIMYLASLGWKIMKFNAKGKYFSGQRLGYALVKTNYPLDDKNVCTSMPKAHFVEYDVINKTLRGIGKNFGFNRKGQTVSLKNEVPKPFRNYERKPAIFSSRYEEKLSETFRGKYLGEKKQEQLEIKEGVIGIIEEGKIACIPKAKKTDPQVRLILGGRRQGKSLLEDNLEDIDYHKYEYFCLHLNDLKAETHTRCLEWEGGHFKRELTRFGEPTTPKPCVYLHPTLDEESTEKIHYHEVGFDVSLPLWHILVDDNLVTYNPEWDMKKSATLLEWRKMIKQEGKIRPDGLAYVRSYKEAMDFFKNLKDEGMKSKAERVLTDIFNSNITDRSSGVPSKWIWDTGTSKKDIFPWIACMASDLFPVVVTNELRERQVWFPIWLKFIIETTMKFSKAQNNTTMIYIDEIESLLQHKATREVIERMIRECGQYHVGTTMVVHNFKFIKEGIYAHLTGQNSYKFVFNTGEAELISQLKKEGLSKEQADEIPKLKQFQCYAFGDFILYDLDGTKSSNEGKPIKIVRMKPPNCQHYGG